MCSYLDSLSPLPVLADTPVVSSVGWGSWGTVAVDDWSWGLVGGGGGSSGGTVSGVDWGTIRVNWGTVAGVWGAISVDWGTVASVDGGSVSGVDGFCWWGWEQELGSEGAGSSGQSGTNHTNADDGGGLGRVGGGNDQTSGIGDGHTKEEGIGNGPCRFIRMWLLL